MFKDLRRPPVLIFLACVVFFTAREIYVNSDFETASDPMVRPAIACAALSSAFDEYFPRYAPDDLANPPFAEELGDIRAGLLRMMNDLRYSISYAGEFHENVLSDARQISHRATDIASAQAYIDATWPELQACGETTLAWWTSE